MSRYRNTLTGAIIDSPCNISGGDWVKVTPDTKEPETTENKKSKGK